MPAGDVEASGVQHLCDCFKCELPPPDWYLKRRRADQALERGSTPAESRPS